MADLSVTQLAITLILHCSDGSSLADEVLNYRMIVYTFPASVGKSYK